MRKNDWRLREDIEEDEKIRLIAYYKWESAGWPEGRDMEFWLEAEKELSDFLTKHAWENFRERYKGPSFARRALQFMDEINLANPSKNA